jgi:CRISPR system Cascade subunit CasC
MLINIHILQNYAPSNLNRDENGSPKDAVFGGVPRARISSQSIKRSLRCSNVFAEAFASDGLLATRTRSFPRLLRERLERMKAPEDAIDAISARAPEFVRKSKKDEETMATDDDGATKDSAVPAIETLTKQLIFLSDAEIDVMAVGLLELYSGKGAKAFAKMKDDEITRALGSVAPRSVDIAMFGRMTTSSAFKDVQAAVQVAHPLSTHQIQQEFDYYTAVDDISGESGASFISDTAFNSATYYKYFNVHWEALVEHLDDAATARRAVEALIEAAVTVHPSGKQNSFAAHNLPDLVLVEVRPRNIPVSYVNAFERPVRQSHDRSLMDASVQALGDYLGSVARTFNLQAERAHIATRDVDLVGSTQVTSLDDLLRWLPVGQEQPV